MGQVLSIYLPMWDVELVRRQPKRPLRSGKSRKPAAPPLFLTAEVAGHERIARCCPRSLAIGIARGMSVAEARALCPSAKTLPFDQAYSQKCLALFAEWAMRFSPVVAIDPDTFDDFMPSPDGLLLNVTGTAHLFGGEQMFLAEIATRLNRVGFSVRAAIAPTIGASWALARYSRSALSIAADDSLLAASIPCLSLHCVWNLRYAADSRTLVSSLLQLSGKFRAVPASEISGGCITQTGSGFRPRR